MKYPSELSPCGDRSTDELDALSGLRLPLRLVEFIIENESILGDIPPDISVGDLKAIAFSQANATMTSPKGEGHGSDTGSPVSDYRVPTLDVVPELSGTKSAVQESPDKVEGMFLTAYALPYWRQGPFLVETLKNVLEFSFENVFVSYDADECETFIIGRKSRKTLFTIVGEEIHQDLKDGLDSNYFVTSSTLSAKTQFHFLHGNVNVEDSILQLPEKDAHVLSDFSKKPRFLKLETLFRCFYGTVEPDSPFGYRLQDESVFLTFMGKDVVDYLINNISWPHLKFRNRKGRKKSPSDERITINDLLKHKRKKVMYSKNLGSCYYAPLLEHALQDGYGRLVDESEP